MCCGYPSGTLHSLYTSAAFHHKIDKMKLDRLRAIAHPSQHPKEQLTAGQLQQRQPGEEAVSPRTAAGDSGPTANRRPNGIEGVEGARKRGDTTAAGFPSNLEDGSGQIVAEIQRVKSDHPIQASLTQELPWKLGIFVHLERYWAEQPDVARDGPAPDPRQPGKTRNRNPSLTHVKC